MKDKTGWRDLVVSKAGASSDGCSSSQSRLPRDGWFRSVLLGLEASGEAILPSKRAGQPIETASDARPCPFHMKGQR